MKPIRINRREFLHYAGAGLVSVAAGVLAGCDGLGRTEAAFTSGLGADNVDKPFEPDLEIAMTALPGETAILPGAPTRVWRYQAEVIQGRPSAVQTLPDSYLGPILRLRKGERVRVRFTNELDEPTIVHWHGMHVPESADGHPRLVIGQGETYTYEFPVLNRAGTYWYHPHPHGRTGPQVYQGLAGLLIVEDEEETALSLPSGAHDIPLVIQDRSFTNDNQLSYLGNGMSARITGFLGDQILVNGQPNYALSAAPGQYRFRILNGSNSRIYKLGWQDDRPLTVIGTDGGLLERPAERPYITLAPGERLDLWVDFSEDAAGSRLVLENKDFLGSGTFDILTVNLDGEASTAYTLPDELAPLNGYAASDARNQRRPREFELQMARMQWLINGKSFEMDGVTAHETVRLGDLEVWEFINQGTHMAIPHPMHIHNVQFQVIERQVLPQFASQLGAVDAGYVDDGWKDTVLLMPGERVKVLLKFEYYAGLYLYHCHNLEHEDMGMMRNFLVKS
jgi:FtsP/CotA-like multicopper oxidase with cupredoxin domain